MDVAKRPQMIAGGDIEDETSHILMQLIKSIHFRY